jgi:hypothetical protein
LGIRTGRAGSLLRTGTGKIEQLLELSVAAAMEQFSGLMSTLKTD